MSDHGHVKGPPKLSRNRCLKDSPSFFTPLSFGSETESLRYTPYVGIDGQNVPSERIQHDAKGSLPCDTREACQILLDLIVRHDAEAVQTEYTLSRIDFAQNGLNLRGLRRRKPSLVDEFLELIRRRIPHCIPGRERVAEAGIRPYVLDLLGHSGKNQEYQIVERIEWVEVAGIAISHSEPFLDHANPACIARWRVCNSWFRHDDTLGGIVLCSRRFASVE